MLHFIHRLLRELAMVVVAYDLPGVYRLQMLRIARCARAHVGSALVEMQPLDLMLAQVLMEMTIDRDVVGVVQACRPLYVNAAAARGRDDVESVVADDSSNLSLCGWDAAVCNLVELTGCDMERSFDRVARVNTDANRMQAQRVNNHVSGRTQNNGKGGA